VRELREELENLARDLGSDLFGISDLETARSFIEKQGGQSVAAFPRAITIGIRLLDAVVDELCQHEEPSVLFTYRGLYNSVNAQLDRTALLVAKKVQEMGYKAYPILASQTSNPTKLQGVFSHKLAAHLSGLGWIGKSCLLITPDHGPRVRLATVLTDAPLKTGAPLVSRCGDCKKCIDICPAEAFTGIPFDPSEPREARFKAGLCKEYTDRRARLFGEGLCGLCVYVCPYGTVRRISRNANST
jgi:epoxyqueuosine reductase QueG